MKYSLALVAAGAAFVAAQDVASLPECGRTCINNMLGIATSQFGCGQNDVLCYCREPNFGYGVRDCANQACGSGEASTVIAFGTQYCANALQSASSGAATTGASALSVLSSADGANPTQASGSGSAESTATVTSTTTGEGNSTETGAAAAGAGISAINGGTSGYAVGSTTLTAGGDALSTSGVEFSALPSAAGVVGAIGAGAAGATDSAGNAISTATDSAGNAISSATDSAASEASDASSSASEGASSAESSATEAASSAQSSASDAAASATGSSSAGGVMQTAAPALMGAAAMLIMAL